MLNFNELFNQWRTQPSNGLNQLIDSPNITIGRLLDQEQFLTEYKSGNLKIAEFMKYNRYEELIDLVTIVGPPDDKKRSYKYPLAASQFLSIDNSNANSVDLFLPEKPIQIETKSYEIVQEQVEVQIDQPPQETKAQEGAQDNQINQDNGQSQYKKVKIQAQAKSQTQSEVQDKKDSKPEQVQMEKKQSQNIEILDELQVKEKRIIKIKKTITKRVQRISKEEKPPLILKLLSYFKGQVNYTLAGYVSKILGFLLNKRPEQFFKHFLDETKIHQVINHAQSRSVGELIIKILTHQSTHALQLRQFFYNELLARLSVSSEIYVISNLSAYVCEIIQKISSNLKNNKLVELSKVFFSIQVITNVIKNVMSDDENVSVYNAPVLLAYLTNVPFVLPQSETLIQQFKKLGQLFIQKSCQKLQVQHRNRPKLGAGRIKLLQILRFVLKQNLLNSKEIVASKRQFFPILLSLMKEYEMNNVLHNQVIKILDIALLQPKQSSLNKSILSSSNLLNFIYAETEQDKKIRSGGSIYKSRKGYIAHVINLAIKLKQLSSNNDGIKALFECPQFSTVYQNFIEREQLNIKKSLAGFVMKKDNKHEVMFLKQDIIAAYLTFFQKCPNAVFEPECKLEEHVNIEHPDLVEELQKQLQENLAIKPKEGQTEPSTKVQKEKEHQAVEFQILEEQKSQGKFWATHLQYNIDDLIDEL